MRLLVLLSSVVVNARGQISSEIYDSSTCGKPIIAATRFIKGGTQIKGNEFPWSVGIYANGQRCGGTLVSNKHVLTSINCFVSHGPRGDHDLSTHSVYLVGLCANGCLEPEKYERNVKRISLQDDWFTYGGVKDSIVLVELDSPVPKGVHHACLPTSNFRIDEKKDDIIVSGVGDRHDGEEARFGKLMKVVLGKRYNTRMTRLTKLRPNVQWFKGEFAVVSTGRKAVCNGDYGGGATSEINGRHVLVGIAARSSCPFDNWNEEVAVSFFTDVVVWLPRILKAMDRSIPAGNITTQPDRKLIFSAPYDRRQTVPLKIINTSTRRIAFNVKRSNLNRLGVQPETGVLDPQKAVLLKVSCEKFIYGKVKTDHDQLEVEWTNTPIEAGATAQFNETYFGEKFLISSKILPIDYNA